MFYPEIDETGEHIADRSGSNYGLMLRDVAPGNSLLIELPPEVPSWWDGTRWVAKPARPSLQHTWDRVGKSWTDPRTLAQLKTDKAGEMRDALQRAGTAPITVAGFVYDADSAAMAAIAQEVQLGALTPTALINWTLANNTVRPHTLSQLRSVALAIRTRNTADRARYEARRATIAAAATPAAVAAVVW